MVSDGGFISALLYDDRRQCRAAAGRDVQQRRRRQPRHTPIHAVAVVDIGVGVQHAVDDVYVALHEAGIRFTWNRHTLLYDRAFAERRIHRPLPIGGGRVPPQHHTFASVFVVWLQDEPLAFLDGERDEIHRSALVVCAPLLEATRPGDVRIDHPALFGAEETGIALVAQDRQAG